MESTQKRGEETSVEGTSIYLEEVKQMGFI